MISFSKGNISIPDKVVCMVCHLGGGYLQDEAGEWETGRCCINMSNFP